MVWDVLRVPEAWPQILTILALVLLAAVLLVVNVHNRVNRAFAAYLGLLSANLLVGILMIFGGDPAAVDYFARIFPYVAFAVPASLFYFLLAVRGRPASPSARRLVLAFLALATLIAEAAYLLDHALFWEFEAQPDGSMVFTSVGPLVLLMAAAPILHAAAVLLFIQDYLARSTPLPARSLLLVAVGLGLHVVYVQTGALFQVAQSETPFPGSFWNSLFLILYNLALLPLLAAIFLLVRRFVQVGPSRERTVVGSALIALATPMLAVIAFQLAGATTLYFGRANLLELAVNGIFRLAFPVLVTYALVRHQLFGIELRVRVAIRRTTVAGFFVSAFFAFSELAQNLIASAPINVNPGAKSFIGIVGAAFLLFLLSPLQRMAHHVSQAATPSAKPLADMSHLERVGLFREQARFAWGDGKIDRRERIRLDSLRQKLGLSAAEAARIESEELWPKGSARRPAERSPAVRLAPKRAPTSRPSR